MAFINEELTPEQKKEFNSWGIKYPLYFMGHLIREEKLENPCHWTVDRERNIYLLGVYYDRNHFEEKVFVFIWNKNTYIVQFRESFEDGNTLVWNIPEHYVSKDIIFPYCQEEGFIDDLRSALTAYGMNGTVNEWNIKIKTKCNF